MDKEGGLVAILSSTFGSKAAEAIEKDFKPRKAKALALHLINGLNLDGLEKEIHNCQQNILCVFVTTKTKNNKPDCPFRVVVTEEGSSKKLVSNFFQRALKGLTPTDPFAVQSSLSFVEHLTNSFPSANPAFSVDIEDMFYSIHQDKLLEAVRKLIENNRTVSFQNK